MISVVGYTVGMSTNLMNLAQTAVRRSDLSLYEIARRAGISYSRVHDLVNGRTTMARSDTVGKIIDACGAGVTLTWKAGAGKKGR